MRQIIRRKTGCYCIKLKRAANAMTRYYDKALEPTGLTVSQFSLLGDMALLGLCSKGELAQAAGLQKSTISRNLKLLRGKGLVKDLSDQDSRESRMILTDKGREALARAETYWENVQADIEEKIDEKAGLKQLDQFLVVLGVLENL